MNRLFLILCLIEAVVVKAYAQTNTDIYILDLSVSAGQLTLSNPKNITNKVGYDNQPLFHPVKPILYYVSMMPDKQTDVWSYNISTEKSTQLTNTPDSEYSPTVIPGSDLLSCIVQRAANGDQDLVKYNLSTPSSNTVILESQKTGKVGYQAWITDNELISFILGSPPTLHFMNLAQRKDTVLVPDIGRSLHRIPKQNAFSFVQKNGSKWVIRSYAPAKNKLTDIAESQAESAQYHAWTSDGVLLESRENKLWSFNPRINQWQPVRLPADLPNRNISRLTVQKNKVVIVLDE